MSTGVRVKSTEYKKMRTYRNLLCPFVWDPHVSENRTTKLITGLISNNRGIFGICEARELVGAGKDHFDVVFEVVNDGLVSIELHDLRISGVVSGEIKSSPAEEGVFTTMVVILWTEAIGKCRWLATNELT